jgi:hypothetical protein
MASEAQFISWGLTKDKWPYNTVEVIQDYLNDPSKLDDELDNLKFLDAFYNYFDWYWREYGDKPCRN